jgi:hypothetical protein
MTKIIAIVDAHGKLQGSMLAAPSGPAGKQVTAFAMPQAGQKVHEIDVSDTDLKLPVAQLHTRLEQLARG